MPAPQSSPASPPTPATKAAWEILPSVSRSFALVTRYLAEDRRTNLGDAVMVFYLVCRVLDTIEDSEIPQQDKTRLYGATLAALNAPPRATVFDDPALLTDNPGYRELLERLPLVLDAYSALEPFARAIIERHATEMATGMDAFGDREIETFADLDAYCHPVAVVVGYGLSELFSGYGHMAPLDELGFARARHFGLALQKVNITRDYGQDLAMGRHFWPRSLLRRRGLDASTVSERRGSPEALAALDEMIDATAPNIEAAMAYLLRIPPEEKRLRMFCAVSLFLALATLARVRGNPDVFVATPTISASLKVSRQELGELVASLFDEVGDDLRLRSRYQTLRQSAFR